jgi:corrinoid protein of di/trimethylamine methyltransferase
MAETKEKGYFDKLAQTIIDGQKDECIHLINEGLAQGIDPLEAIEKGLGQGIIQVGDDFGEGRCFLPELIMAADVMKDGVAILDERIKAEGRTRKSLGKIVIGTVKGDIHDIGKSVVAAVLQANGYDVVDLGIDVDKERFVKAVEEHDADCLGMSSLLTLAIQEMGTVIEKLKDEGLRDKIKVIVGGCPVTQEFADEIGADAVGFDAADAVRKMEGLLGGK